MKFLFDLLPVILFFAAFKLYDIWIATGVAIGATVLQVAWLLARRKKVDTMLWVSLAIVVIAGGATLFLGDERFIKWKPTLLYGCMALALLFTQHVLGKNPMKALMGGQISMPDEAWLKLTWSWAVFFVFMAALNLVVAFNFPTDTWVNFKLFGGMGLLIAFAVAQSFWLAKYMPDELPKPAAEDANKK
jgi:intracellular septation protein